MLRIIFQTLFFVGVIQSVSCQAETYAAGSSGTVSGWKERDYSSTKLSGKPYCVYIVDPSVKNNQFAKFIEGKEILGHAEVQGVLATFLKVKIKLDHKLWPAEWRSRAENGSALLLSSSDGRQVVFFDKTQKDILKKDMVVGAVKPILAAEEKLQKERDEKKAEVERLAKEARAKALAEAKVRKEAEEAAKKKAEKAKAKGKEPVDE